MKARIPLLAILALALPLTSAEEFFLETDVPVPMRDAVILRADVWRPSSTGVFPVLVYRTPYGKHRARQEYTIFRRAVERGYVVVIQDVRGRYASDGAFNPYQQEGPDGYDTIKWAAGQPWSNGAVGTFGLSYPGALQWLAAVESPPSLKAMVPAMTFSTPSNFFYSGGVFDLSWIGWIWNNIAPDTRRRRNLPGPTTYQEAHAAWDQMRHQLQQYLPLGQLPEFREVAPYYFEWLRHPPGDSWWEWAELRNKYHRVTAAVLNLSGWYDEAYGSEGALTNFLGLRATRRGERDPRTQVVIGPWVHGVGATGQAQAGERNFGPSAVVDYDELVLDWMDCYVRGFDNGVARRKPIRIFVMGKDSWREEEEWPPRGTRYRPIYLMASSGGNRVGQLSWNPPETREQFTSFVSNPAEPVVDQHPPYSGAHDYRALAARPDVLVFDSEPLGEDLEVTGPITAEIFLAADAPDTDLWVRLLDVAPDGTAFNLMSPGLDVIRASYRDGGPQRSLLVPGKVYRLRLNTLLTSNVFRRGHRIRVQVSASFFPHFSRNLHTGELETISPVMRSATLRIYHDRRRASRLLLPIRPAGPN